MRTLLFVLIASLFCSSLYAQAQAVQAAVQAALQAKSAQTSERDTLLISLHAMLDKPYPSRITAPVDSSLSLNLRNFFRERPDRKVAVVFIGSGDYEYDEDMTQDIDIALSIEARQFYKMAGKAISTNHGEPLAKAPVGLLSVNHDDDSKEGQSFNNEAWSPEYEGGAIFDNADNYDTQHWKIGADVLTLQWGTVTGDGDFDHFVLMTLTPLRLSVISNARALQNRFEVWRRVAR
jgi:hypothetical protein